VRYPNDYGLGSIGKQFLSIIFGHTQHPVDAGTLKLTKVAANSAEPLGVLAHKTIRVGCVRLHKHNDYVHRQQVLKLIG
jgi:hypothetical protein